MRDYPTECPHTGYWDGWPCAECHSVTVDAAGDICDECDERGRREEQAAEAAWRAQEAERTKDDDCDLCGRWACICDDFREED